MDHVLYWSGSIGLGHVTRDIAIADHVMALNPGTRIDWLAGSPAREVLREAGENVLPESEGIENGNELAATTAHGPRFNLGKWSMGVRRAWEKNGDIYRKVVGASRYDVVVGDECFEASMALTKYPELAFVNFVLMYDYLGIKAMGWSPMERLVARSYNRFWSRSMLDPLNTTKAIFIGEREDIPDERFGLLLPGKREAAEHGCEFVGYAIGFDPGDLRPPAIMKERLGYGDRPLVVCSIGGTAVGRELLGLCNEALPLVRKEIADARMVLVGGPAYDPGELRPSEGVSVRSYVPRLWEHFAASDLSVVVGGGTSTMELIALQRPFIYLPLEGHHEQQGAVADRCARYGAGIRFSFSTITPRTLADAIIANIGREVHYPPIPVDGARKAAEYISWLGQGRRE